LTLRHKSLDILASQRTALRATPTSPMDRHPVQLGVSWAEVERQNAAVVQACVPTVARISAW